MEGQSNRIWLVLSWVWVAVVSAYMIWGMVNQAGLYAWFAELQMGMDGSYSERLTLLLPGLVLISPAAWYLGRHSRLRRAQEDAELGPEAAIRRQDRQTRWAAIGGVVALAVAGGAYAISQTVPDGTETPIPFDAASLATGTMPASRIQVRGTVDPNATTGVTQTVRGEERHTFYVGFRPDGDTDKNAPLRLFIERYAGAGPPVTQGFMPEQEGYLTRNGLSGMALRELRGRGIRIAEPHYLLSDSGTGKRDIYYIVAALAGFLGFVLLLSAGITYFRTPTD